MWSIGYLRLYLARWLDSILQSGELNASKRKFSKRSVKALRTCHRDLRMIAILSLQVSPVDFSIVEGHRSFNKQLDYFLDGASKLDPRDPEQYLMAMHLKDPAQAFDFCAYVPGKPELAYNNEHLVCIGTTILIVAQTLHYRGITKGLPRWGGNWDRDGEILTDQIFDDRSHIEIHLP